MNNITFYLEDDDGKIVDFNGALLAFAVLFLKIKNNCIYQKIKTYSLFFKIAEELNGFFKKLGRISAKAG